MKAINFDNYEFVIKQNMGLVYKVVQRFNVNPFERDDLIQAGLIGIWKAARRYNPGRGCFSTYALPFIIGEVKSEYKKLNIITVNNYFRSISRKVSEKLSLGNIQKIAIACNTSVENVVLATNLQKVILIDAETADEYFVHNSTVNHYFLSSLTPRDREIFCLRFFEHRSQKEIASRLKISQSSISRRLYQMARYLKTL